MWGYFECNKTSWSTYEKTLSSYKGIHDEDLRNILLAKHNTIYQSDAIGEGFRNNSKTDILIERENLTAFVAKCKMWDGQKEITDAIHWLDGYLTWRDCKTALIFFCQKKRLHKIQQYGVMII